MKKHQLPRVLRVDKMTLAALEATLKEYANEPTVSSKLPTLRSILLSKKDIRRKMEMFLSDLSPFWTIKIEDGVSQVGGGTMPEVKLDTEILLVSNSAIKAQDMHEKLRNGVPAVVSRIIDGKIALDYRTIEEE